MGDEVGDGTSTHELVPLITCGPSVINRSEW